MPSFLPGQRPRQQGLVHRQLLLHLRLLGHLPPPLRRWDAEGACGMMLAQQTVLRLRLQLLGPPLLPLHGVLHPFFPPAGLASALLVMQRPLLSPPPISGI